MTDTNIEVDQRTKPHWLVFSDDWGRHPSSCQYLIAQVLDEVNVTWVNSIGMRTPQFNLATLRRAAGKLRSAWLRQSNSHGLADDRPTPNVLNPLMWPWFTTRFDRWLNERLLVRNLSRTIEHWPTPRIAVTSIPIVADLIGKLPVDRWIYYCVDDFSVWPGLDQATMLKMEKDLLSKVDVVVAVSEVLQSRLKGLGYESELLTHGVDMDQWCPKNGVPYAWPCGIESPVALFWGVIDRRLDSSFVKALAIRLKRGSIVFVGPQQDPDHRLAAYRNVHFLPPVQPKLLASMAQSAHCLIMPYTDSPVTRAMQPLKLKEYLSTGQPVVVRSLPATEGWSDSCEVVSSADAFAQACIDSMACATKATQLRARERLRREDWSAKASEFRSYLVDSTI